MCPALDGVELRPLGDEAEAPPPSSSKACLAFACVALVASVVFLGALNTLRFFARALRGRVARTVHGLETFALDISEAGDDDDDRPRGSPMTV